VQTEFIPLLFGHDARFEHPTQDEAAAVDMGAVETWLAPHFADAPLEVSIVGDLDVEHTIEIAARTFGRLPPRRDWRAYDERRVVSPPASGLREEYTIETQIPKALVLIVFPATDGLDPDVRRRFNVLNTVVNDRLRLEVRERLGAAYSPGAAVDLSTVYPGVGLLVIQAMADPDKVDTLVEACLDVAGALARDGVTADELGRLREPILNQLRDSKRRNGYWSGVLSEAQRRPASLDEVRSLDAFFQNVKADDVTPLAAQSLTRERASIVVVRPASAPE